MALITGVLGLFPEACSNMSIQVGNLYIFATHAQTPTFKTKKEHASNHYFKYTLYANKAIALMIEPFLIKHLKSVPR